MYMHVQLVCLPCFSQEPAYNPQVEAISPTPSTNEDTKSELVTNISKMDKEITNTSNEITRLVKKQVGLS